MAKPESLRELLEFFRLDAGDLTVLARLREPLERNADRIVGEFYKHLLRFPETQRFLRDPEVRTRLLAKQREYLISLSDPVIDEDYLASRSRIGSVHSASASTRWYLGLRPVFKLLVPLIRDGIGPDPSSRTGAGRDGQAPRFRSGATRRYIAPRGTAAPEQRTARRERDLTQEVGKTARNLRRTEARAASRNNWPRSAP
jgi:hypothetical protein